MKFSGEPLFEVLFPFHLVIDHQDRLIRVGVSTRKICKDVVEGDPFRKSFDFLDRHQGFDRIRRAGMAGLSALLRHRESGVMFRGQFVYDEEASEVLFVGSPWIRSVDHLLELGLVVSDFAKHDAMIDLLQMVQHQESRVMELKAVNDLASERKRSLEEANEKLVARERELERLAGVVTATRNTVILTDENGRIEWVNPSFTATTGYEFEEVRGLKPGDVLQGLETDRAVVKRMHEHLWSGEGFTLDVLNYRKDGRKLWLKLEVRPVRDRVGRLTGFTGLQIDITEEKLLNWMESLFMRGLTRGGDQRSWKSEMNLVSEELAGFAGADRVSIHSVGRGGEVMLLGCHGDFQRCEDCKSEACAGTYDAKGRSMDRGVDHRGSCDCCDREVVPLLSNEKRVIGMLEMSKLSMKGGPLKWEYLSISRMLARVIEGRMSDEELEKAREEAERANAAKSMFIASLSHELRNPLQGIVMALDLLGNRHSDSEDSKLLKQLKSRTENIERIVGDLLIQEGAEYGTVEVIDGVYSPAEVLERVRLEYLDAADEAGLELRVGPGEELAAMIGGDGGRVSQVLSNLVGNAIKFTERGQIEVSGRIRGEWIEFEVSDSGCGFPEEVEDRLFEPYYQWGGDHRMSMNGVGLGLSICRTLVVKMGGEIGAFRKAEGGSRFCFRLPLKELGEVACKAEPGDGSVIEDKRCVRLILAEDDPLVGELLVRLLETEGHVVHRVANGAEALDWIRREGDKYDGALVDQRMPEMDGVELATRVRAGEAGEEFRQFPMIALTASVGEQIRTECLAAGFNRFLAKPVSFDELLQVLEETFG
jgi:PAS domain S-box-containing protein